MILKKTYNPLSRNVIVGRSYDLVIDIFDSSNNKIFPSSNIIVEVEIPEVSKCYV